MTNILMVLIVFFLIGLLAFKAKAMPNADHFFDVQNTVAMRGFWCLIVVMVHIPAVYQNRIQDMIGSFAYIGVTFFFMTSGYGLKIGLGRDPESIRFFWRKRLPKLLVPMFFVNIVSMVFGMVEGHEISALSLIYISGWVKWLLVCYFIFWIVYIQSRKGHRDLVICSLVVLFSVVVYMYRDSINRTTWCPEVFGFVYGIILADARDKFAKYMHEKWLLKCIVLCIASLMLGVAYLKFKPIVFFGDYLLKIVLGLVILLFILALNTRIKIGNNVSSFLGNVSYEVYLLHGAVFGLIAFLAPNVNSGLFVLLSIVITVFVSWIVRLLCKLVMKNLNLLLVGIIKERK